MSIQTWQETLVSLTADGTALTAIGRASLTQGNATGARITLPNNFFKVGTMIKITAQGRISCVITTPGTARFDVAFATVANCDSGALNLNIVAKVNVPWWVEIVGTCRTAGAGTAATIFWFGSFQSEAVIASPLPTAGGNGSLLFTHGGVGATAVGAGFDSTAAIPLDLYFSQTVSTGSITLQQYKVEALN
jgi:hypothetical protein